jgi:excisionase family DNA binding protein
METSYLGMDIVLTTREAADDLGLTVRQVRNLIKRGTLPARKVGRDWLIKAADVEVAQSRPRPGRPKQEVER